MEHELKSIIPDDVIKHLDTMEFRVDSKNCLEAIQSLLQSSVLVGGKRLRPLLTLLMGHLFRLDLKLIQPYAKAVELVHAASLSHDDVIDNATLRRGKPSINVLASNKKAVLAGDTLLSLTIVELAECQNHFALELVKEMSYVIRDLSEGEWLQSDFIQERNYTLSKIKTIADKKTASVMGYCSVAPAFVFLGEYLKRNSLLLEERDTKLLDLSKTFGQKIGIAFQLIDDTLDFQSSEDTLKDQLLDLENGILNSVSFDFLSHYPKEFEDYKNGRSLLEETFQTILKNGNLTYGIQHSVKAIRALADKELEEAYSILDKIYDLLAENYFLSNDFRDKDENLKPLRGILSLIALRSH